jgi:predicted branched-subunit amino acid permease
MAYLAGNVTINWVDWTSFSVLGLVLVNSIPPQRGLGFTGILALPGRLCSSSSRRLRWISVGIAGAAVVATFTLPLKLNILMAIVVTVALYLIVGAAALTISIGSQRL